MNRFFKEREERIIKSLAIVVGLITALYGYILYFTAYFPTKCLQIIFVSIVIIITIAIIYKGRDKIFKWALVRLWHTAYEDKTIIGSWMINIYFSETSSTVDRTGHLKIEDTFAGIQIRGGNLHDTKTNKVSVYKWFSREAEYYHFKDKKMLIYHYWLQDGEDCEKFSKIGIVTATSIDGGQTFTGTFKDIVLEDGSISRTGKVNLIKSDSTVSD